MTRSIGRRSTHFRPLAALILIAFGAQPGAARSETAQPEMVQSGSAQSGEPVPAATAPAASTDSPKPDQLLAAADDAKPLDAAKSDGETPPPAAPPQAAPLSEAEQITNLQKALESDSKRVEEMRHEMIDPRSEFRRAEEMFKECDARLIESKASLTKLKENGTAEEVAAAQSALSEIERRWEQSRERFNLVLESRKTGQEQIAALEAKIRKNSEALQKLLGTVPESEGVPKPESSGGMPAPIVTASAPPPVPSAVPAPATPAAVPGPSSTSAPASGSAASAASASPAVAESAPVTSKAPTKELVEAQTQVDRKQEEAVVAKQAAESVVERIAALDKDIGLENKLLVAARKKSDLAFQTRGDSDQEYEKLIAAGAGAQEIRELHQRRREANSQFSRARIEVAERMDRLNDLQTQRAVLQREALAATTTVDQKEREVDQARIHVAKLQNPFSPNNVLQWLLDHGLRILIILLAILFLRLSARFSSKRITSLISQRGSRGTLQEREDRARTLVGVFRNAFSITTTIGGTLMICEEVGIAVGPLMGGAAVLGLAVAFGAQNLIRDYFYGFVILIENQYKLNDVLKIGDVSGQVEQITLRMTVLRDQEGNVHFVPNGKIDSVTNMSHGWSRALIEVGVAYKEDVDQCLKVLMAVAEDLQMDPDFSNSFLDRPEMLGVDSLGESAVKLRILIKTRPLHQWRIKREMYRRIKGRFDELGIEIPFPQHTVHHRQEPVPAEQGTETRQRVA